MNHIYDPELCLVQRFRSYKTGFRSLTICRKFSVMSSHFFDITRDILRSVRDYFGRDFERFVPLLAEILT